MAKAKKLKSIKLFIKKLPPLKPAKTIVLPPARSTKKAIPNKKKLGKAKLKQIVFGKIKVAPKMKWYVLVVNMNFSDSKCRKQIHNLKHDERLKKLIGKICIPKEKYEGQTEDGQKVERERAKFKGYVILQCIMTREVREELNGLPSVYTVLMRPGNEVALSTEEEANLYMASNSTPKQKKSDEESPPLTLDDMYPSFLEQTKKKTPEKVITIQPEELEFPIDKIDHGDKYSHPSNQLGRSETVRTTHQKDPKTMAPVESFAVGDKVGITDPGSSFYDYIGPIMTLNDGAKAKVSIDLLGRPCEVTVPYHFLKHIA